jgi:hypothetical protein
LKDVIKEAKRMEYNKLILNSHNRIKTTGRNNDRNYIQAVNVEGKKIIDQQSIASMNILLLLLSILIKSVEMSTTREAASCADSR